MNKFMEGHEPEKRNTEEARFHDNLMVLLSKDSTEEQIETVEREMAENPKLREYIDERLPRALVAEYASWNFTMNQSSEEMRDELIPGESEDEMRDRMSMSDNQIKLLFGFDGKRDTEIKDAFEEQFDLATGPESEATESEVKSGSWDKYQNFRNIADYVYGKASDIIQNEINDRLISDEQFRNFIDKIKKALGK